MNKKEPAILEYLISNPPSPHLSETEVENDKYLENSLLSESAKQTLGEGGYHCYGIEPQLAEFIYDNVDPGFYTLETGAGLSTLVFALCRSKHICITPSKTEVDIIKTYGVKNNIDLGNVTFIHQGSEDYLPQLKANIDIVLLDGKHAFPWPFIDWFYSSRILKTGGQLILDDINIEPVCIIKNFMLEDNNWSLHKFFDKSCVFIKTGSNIHDTAWHMQPYVMNRYRQKDMILNIIINKLNSYLRKFEKLINKES